MEELRNRINSTGIGSLIEPEVVQEKLVVWSSSVYSKLTYDNFRDTFASIGRAAEPENIQHRTVSYFASITAYLEENPILFSISLRGETQTYVNLPYFGAVSLDVFLFWSTAALTRAHMFLKSRRQTPRITRDDGGSSSNESSGPQDPPSSPVKSTVVEGYKDESLYRTMRECQDVKTSLRKSPDPDLVRKEKKKNLRLQNIGTIRTKLNGKSSGDGYLGVSPNSLYQARRFLKQSSRGDSTQK